MDRTARSRTSRVLLALAVTGVLPMLAGCPEKKTPVVVDAGAPPPPPPTDTVTNLVPMDDTADAGDADADAGAPKKLGPAVNPNVARLKQCCTALANQAKANANSPEGQMMMTAAAQCSAAAAAVGPSGTAPEFATIRTMLTGHTIPAVCQGM